MAEPAGRGAGPTRASAGDALRHAAGRTGRAVRTGRPWRALYAGRIAAGPMNASLSTAVRPKNHSLDSTLHFQFRKSSFFFQRSSVQFLFRMGFTGVHWPAKGTSRYSWGIHSS